MYIFFNVNAYQFFYVNSYSNLLLINYILSIIHALVFI